MEVYLAVQEREVGAGAVLRAKKGAGIVLLAKTRTREKAGMRAVLVRFLLLNKNEMEKRFDSCLEQGGMTRMKSINAMILVRNPVARQE